MDFSISQEQQAYITNLRNFIQAEINSDCLPFHSKWSACAEYGLFGIPYNEDFGGIGESYATAALMMEELGYSCEDNGFTFCVTNHVWACLNSLYCYGTKTLHDKYLKSMINGGRIGALALTEADSGSSLLSIETTAEPADDGYILNGSKAFISNGPIADIFIISARTGKPGALDSISCFVCEREFPGLTTTGAITKMGLEKCPMSNMRFKDVFVPRENLLGKIGAGIGVLNGILEWERCFEFAVMIGAMKRVMEACIKYCLLRKLNKHQAITHKIAQMKIHIELAQLLMQKIAWMKDKGRNAFLEASIYKYFVSEKYVQTCLDMLQIFGAYGYVAESKIEVEVRDALASKIYAGTSEIQLNIIYNFIEDTLIASKSQ